MSTSLDRRAVLAIWAVVPAAMVGACSVTSTGGLTTATIDVATLTRDGLAVVASLQAALAAPSLVLLLGPSAIAAAAALAGVEAAMAELQSLTGGTVVLAANTARVQGVVQTLILGAQNVLGLAQPALIGRVSGVGSTVSNYLAAASALLPFLALAASLPLPVSASDGVRAMSEQQALTVAAGAR